MKTKQLAAWLGTAAALSFGVAVPALADTNGQAAKAAQQIDDGWITTKVKTQFVGVDVLEGSDIDVNTSHGVVTLSGHVASEAGRVKAVAIAKKTDGVTKVVDKLTIAPGRHGDGTTARSDANKAKDAGQSAGSTINDGWITTKLKAKFVPEDALDGSDIKVETTNGVVTLTGSVPSTAGKRRAVEIAQATEGVRQVVDRTTIVPGAARHDQAESGRTDTGQSVSDPTAGGGARSESAADKVGDGWITAKVKSQFIGVDVLKGSDIHVETTEGVVTLTGTVGSVAAKQRAEALAKTIDGVKSVRNQLTVGTSR